MLFIAYLLVSSSHETFVEENRCFLVGAIVESVLFPGLSTISRVVGAASSWAKRLLPPCSAVELPQSVERLELV